MSAALAITPHFTRLQASAVLTLLDDLDNIALGLETMPEEFWQHLNAAYNVLTAEMWAGIDTGRIQ